MKVGERIKALVALGETLVKDENKQWIEEVFFKAKAINPWFTIANCQQAIEAIRSKFLQEEVLEKAAHQYDLNSSGSKRVGFVLAGNVPAVGFHDLVCCFLSGHKAIVKLSSKDHVLINMMLDLLYQINPATINFFEIVDRLKKYDGVVATGGNNTAKHFEHYFQHVPHIIRKSRNAVAIIDGSESEDDLNKLGRDIFDYFGLGCRNVSKVYLPISYSKDVLLGALHEYNDVVMHHKYKNNFDYNVALFLLNREKYLNNGSIILKEDARIASRIACLHYQEYEDKEGVAEHLHANAEQIQCVISKEPITGFNHFYFGKAQQPSFFDFADGVDTLEYLTTL